MTPINLLVAMSGDGGLAAFDGTNARFVDRVSTTGLGVGGGRLYRVCPFRAFEGAELLVYDATGIRTYQRYDDVGDPHDVLACDDGAVLCASPLRDAILRLHGDGTTTVVEGGERSMDARHVNCLTRRDGKLYASAFGNGETFREWKRPDALDDGVVFEVDTGQVVVDGLAQPHSPLWIDGAWVVCDSARGSVVRCVPGGSRTSTTVGGFTRGMYATDDAVYVGVSVRGESPDVDTAELVELDRTTLTERARHRLPGQFVSSIVGVDDTLAAAVERGFSTGSRRQGALGQVSLFAEFGAAPRRLWAVGIPLAREDRRCTLRASLPSTMAAREAVIVDVEVLNRGAAFFVGAVPARVALTYRWLAHHDDLTVNVKRAEQVAPIPQPIAPGESATIRLLLVAPDEPGTYELLLTLMHQALDFDGDAESAVRVTVRVDPPVVAVLEPGQRVAFTSGDERARSLLGWGWAEPEETGVWSIASPAHVVFRVPADGSYAVALDVAFYRPESDTGVLRVVLDGTEVLAQMIPDTLSSIVTRSVELRAGDSIVMTVHASTLFRPADHGLPDARSLGVHLIALRLVAST